MLLHVVLKVTVTIMVFSLQYLGPVLALAILMHAVHQMRCVRPQTVNATVMQTATHLVTVAKMFTVLHVRKTVLLVIL